MFSRSNGSMAAAIILVWILLMPFSCFGADNGNAALHAGISAIFGAAGETWFHYKTDLEAPGRVFLGTYVGSLPGLAKELTDGRISGSDLAADVAGAFLGALAANFVNTRLKITVESQARRTTVWLTYSF